MPVFKPGNVRSFLRMKVPLVKVETVMFPSAMTESPGMGRTMGTTTSAVRAGTVDSPAQTCWGSLAGKTFAVDADANVAITNVPSNMLNFLLGFKS